MNPPNPPAPQPAGGALPAQLPPSAAQNYPTLEQVLKDLVKAVLQDPAVLTQGHVMHKLHGHADMTGPRTKALYDAICDPACFAGYDAKVQGLFDIVTVLWAHKDAFIAAQ